ncbi:hypothetical protein GOODEAATRI_018010 [Goodea atripinnis]|uniref:Uncharacterized protein n=1 Tax=Goodea atripinnis TaxID=208336 RepID=A0ABV0MIR8_9TELE
MEMCLCPVLIGNTSSLPFLAVYHSLSYEPKSLTLPKNWRLSSGPRPSAGSVFVSCLSASRGCRITVPTLAFGSELPVSEQSRWYQPGLYQYPPPSAPVPSLGTDINICLMWAAG